MDIGERMYTKKDLVDKLDLYASNLGVIHSDDESELTVSERKKLDTIVSKMNILMQQLMDSMN